MKGLYISVDSDPGQHIGFLSSLHPGESFVANKQREAFSRLKSEAFDFLFIENKKSTLPSRFPLAQLTETCRRLHPACAIILYAPNSKRLWLPVKLLDLCISRELAHETALLPKMIEALVFRRQHPGSDKHLANPVTGVTYGPYPEENYVLKVNLKHFGFDAVTYQDVDKLEAECGALNPDFLISHCHTGQQDFARIKELCARFKSALPQSTVLVTCSAITKEDYIKWHALDTFEYDYLIDSYINYDEVIGGISEGIIRKFGCLTATAG